MIHFELKHPKANLDMLGYIPEFLSENDPRDARVQFAEQYIGGWRPTKGFTMADDAISYAGDPPRPLIAEAKLRAEIVRFYLGAWVAVIQPDGSYEISHMD